MDLRMLHKTDLSPIRYAKVCRKDGKELSMDDIVKGYEYQEGDYIVLTDEDFKNAAVERTQAIDVVDFVKESEIDTIYFENEVKAPEKLNIPKHETSRSKELTMAMSLIDHLTEKFDIGDYHDAYRKDLDKMIQNKIKGHKSVKVKDNEAPHPTKTADLMLLLKQSLEKANQKPLQA